MRLDKIEICHIEQPLVEPFRISIGTETSTNAIIVKIFDKDGVYGVGEAPTMPLPLYKPDFTLGVKHLIQELFSTCLKDKEFDAPQEFDQYLEFIKGNEFAKAALSMAVYDIYCRQKDITIFDYLKIKPRTLEISKTIGICDNTDQMLDKARRLYESGISCIKLKIAPGFDIHYVKTLRKTFPDAQIMVDANAAYTLNDIDIFKKLDEFNLLAIEQPLRWDDLIDHATLQKQIKTPIALDESIGDFSHVQKALEIGSCKLINIKVARVGGVTETLKIHDYCYKRGVPVWIGGMIELPVGFWNNLIMACLPGCMYPVDFAGAPFMIKDFNTFYDEPFFELKGKNLHIQKTSSPTFINMF